MSKDVSPADSGWLRDESQLKQGLPLFEVSVTLAILAFWAVSLACSAALLSRSLGPQQRQPD